MARGPALLPPVRLGYSTRSAHTTVRSPSPPSGRVLLLSFLLFAGATLAQDGGADSDAGTDVSVDAGGLALDDEEELSALQGEVDALRALSEGAVPEGVGVTTLFEIDLRGEDEVRARLEVLTVERDRLARAMEEPHPRRLELLWRRATLRREFLSRARTERLAVLEAEERRVRLKQEREQVREAQLLAERDVREAEGARQRALAEARRAETVAAQDLAAERARVEAARSALATLRGERAKEQERLLKLTEELALRDGLLAQRVRGQELPAQAADALYTELIEHPRTAQEAFDAALQELKNPTRAPDFIPRVDLRAARYQSLPGHAELVDSARRLELEVAELRRDEHVARLRRAQSLYRDLKLLDELRLELLPRLSPGYRAELLGFGPRGLEQLRRELRHLELTARWYPSSRAQALGSLREKKNDLFTLGAAGWMGLQLLGLAGATLVVRRRHTGWLRKARVLALSQLRSVPLGMAAEWWLNFLRAVANELGLLVFVHLLFRLLGTQSPELAVARALLFGWALYRLIIAATHHLVTEAAVSRRVEVSEALSQKILHSIQLVGRYALAVHVLLTFSTHVLGRGYLHTLVKSFFWIGVIPIALVLLTRWRSDITGAYLATFPRGRLARAVERNQTSTLGFFVAAGAFGAVAARGLGVYARETLLRFDQTRKGLAFLFRRKMERHAETVGRAAADIHQLPESLREAFSELPAEERLRIDFQPHLDEVLSQVERCQRGGPGAVFALVGERGMGKTTWLLELSRRAAWERTTLLTLEERHTCPREVVGLLAERLGAAGVDSLDGLVRSLREGPRRMVLIDHGQNLMLRAVDGMRGFDTFGELVARTSDHVVWVVSFARFAWEHLEAVCRERNPFGTVLHLRPWTEERIGELIDSRMKHCGHSVSWDDLVVDRVDGTAFANEVIRTGERYRRLLWDYADGNPRVALHFWLRSLVLDGPGSVRVRLFQAPGANELESLTEQLRFLLAAVVVHENLSAEEASRGLRYPEPACEAGLHYLHARAFLTEAGGRYRINTHWNRAVLRYLRRKHLLFS